MDDLISRQMVIDAFYYYPNINWTTLDVIEKIDKVLPAQQWIPCSDRPPEESGDYLVTVAHNSGELWVEVDQFDNENGSWWHYMDDVTAWMPRPKPYKGETDKDYERAVEQMEHDTLYESTYNSEDGSM